jgi:hypothetical protein
MRGRYPCGAEVATQFRTIRGVSHRQIYEVVAIAADSPRFATTQSAFT